MRDTANKLAIAVAAVLAATILLPAATASALTTSGYTPRYATDPANLNATTGVLESLGAQDIAGTPTQPGVPDRVTDPRVGEWFDKTGDVPIKTGATSRSMWAEIGGLERKTLLSPKLASFARVALPAAGLLGGGLFGFAAITAGEYVLGRLLTPSKPTGTLLVWEIAEQATYDKGDGLSSNCFMSGSAPPCGTGNNVTAVHTLTQPTKLYTTSTGVSHFYYCNGGSGGPQSPAAAVVGIPSGATVTLLGTEIRVGGGCGGNGPTITHFDVTAPIDVEEIAPPAPKVPTVPKVTGATATQSTLPTSAALRAAVRTELDSGNYPTLAQWLDHQANPEAVADPTTVDGATFTIPAPNAHETYAAYRARLVTAGALGSIVKAELSISESDPARNPGEAVRTSPLSGTTADVATRVKVFVNNEGAPAGGTGTGGATGGPYGGDSGSPSAPAIDMTPLQVTGACDSFPFGVPCWVSDLVQNFAGGDPVTPEWDFHFPMGGEGDNMHVSLAMLDDAMVPIRIITSILACVSMLWLFFAITFGGVSGKGSGD